MLGSSHDSEDVLQQTLLRAWRARDTLREAPTLRSWLYRIATNVCLDELRSRSTRFLPPDVVAPALDPDHPAAAPSTETPWLQPCPDAWLTATVADPMAAYEVRESVALAFVAALQCLSPQQRAVMLLRDVVGMHAEQAAEALGLSLSAANSALHRAREALHVRTGSREPGSFASAVADVDGELLRRYVAAWEAADLDGLVALMHEDITASMPPSLTWLRGVPATRAFLDANPFQHLRVAGPRLLPIGANGQPAFAFYVPREEGGAKYLQAIHVLRLRGGAVSEIHHFMTPECFPAFAVPLTIA